MISRLSYGSVFAIHGLGSSPMRAWTYHNSSTEVSWLQDLLPLANGLEGIRVIAINHRTSWKANAANMNFKEHAMMVLHDIESLREV